MSEDYDYQPVSWSPTNYKSARAAYKPTPPPSTRGYGGTSAKSVTIGDVIPATYTTDCEGPVIIVTDETGSMADWPSVIFGKLPYLHHEAKTEYRGEDVEFGFMAIGDAHNREKYPLQARPFCNGEDMKNALEKLVLERNGGGTMQETYELAALWLARVFEAPKAILKPLVIFIGDESPYPSVSHTMAKDICGLDMEKHITTPEIFRELQAKASVYMVLKPYNVHRDNANDETNQRIFNDWVKLLGADYVAPLPIADRVVDVIFGIMAREAGKIDYFKEEIEDRQEDEKVDTVYTALHTIHKAGARSPRSKRIDPGKSVIARLPGPTKKTKRLI